MTVQTKPLLNEQTTAVDLISYVQQCFDESAHFFKGAEEVSTLCLKSLTTIREVVDFAYRNLKNKLFLGLAHAHLSNMLRFHKGEYATLSKEERIKIREVIASGSQAYTDYSNNPAVEEKHLPYDLSLCSLGALLGSLRKAISLSNEFMIGHITSLLFIKARKENRAIM